MIDHTKPHAVRFGFKTVWNLRPKDFFCEKWSGLVFSFLYLAQVDDQIHS